MSTIEWLMLIQTLILFMTGIAVAWYTYETYKIRKETSVQNSLLAEQLLILKNSYEFELKKEISFIDPIFRFEGGHLGMGSATIDYINKGGSIKNVSIRPQSSFTAKIVPNNAISADEKFRIMLSNIPQPSSGEVTFEVHFENKLGNKSRKIFKYITKAENLGVEEVTGQNS